MNSTLKLLSTSILLATLTACSGDFVSDDVGISNTGSNSNAGSSDSGTPSETFSISGMLTGLAADQTVTLNNGSDSANIDATFNDQSFTFYSEVPDQTQYNITVSAQPTGQTCVVENASGTIDGMIVNNITIECVDGSYSKINSDGDEVLSTADAWDCVQDYDTGLMWEVKTTDSGLRDSSWQYTWYDTNPATNGGDHGIGDTGVGTTTGYETSSGTYFGSDNCFDGSRCDTEKYVADLNAAQLCGHTDWRLPSKDELSGLLINCTYGVDCDSNNAPLIDQSVFPNTQSWRYWSASPSANYNNYAWYAAFNYGSMGNFNKSYPNHVRLVRGGEPLSIAIIGSGTVSDDPTNYLAGCSDDCTQYYTVGDTVTLTATAGSDQQFTGWSGDCDSISGNECTLIITTGQSVAARFGTPNPNTTGYTKMDSSGGYLADTASDWDCVMDNDSNLMWEVKTTDSGLRDSSWEYTWYGTNPATNGGDHGIGDAGAGTTTGYETIPGIYAGSDNCSDSSRCDTEKFVEDVNNSGGICGYTDWRLPTKDELAGLLNCTHGVDCNSVKAPLIDQGYFPNTRVYGYYWSSLAYAYNNGSAWYVYFGQYIYGRVSGNGKSIGYLVRLVRDSQ